MEFFEASAKQDINVDKAFIKIATDVKNRLISDGGTAGVNSGARRLDNANNNKNKANGGGCC
jgi:hypothetical protein